MSEENIQASQPRRPGYYLSRSGILPQRFVAALVKEGIELAFSPEDQIIYAGYGPRPKRVLPVPGISDGYGRPESDPLYAEIDEMFAKLVMNSVATRDRAPVGEFRPRSIQFSQDPAVAAMVGGTNYATHTPLEELAFMEEQRVP
jgi:hypothetical protein